MPMELRTTLRSRSVAVAVRAGVAVAAAAIALGLAFPAQAQAASALPAPGAIDSGQRSFGVQPAGPKKPDPRANLTYRNVKPGQVFYDHVAFVNISDKPVRLTVYPADGYNTTAGAFDLRKQNEKMRDVGSWVQLRRKVADVPARSALVTPIEIRIPRNAEPGDHAGGIVASLKTLARDRKGNSVSVDQRVGTRVYVRVTGPLRPHLKLESLHGGYAARNPVTIGDATATYTIRNDGNVRLVGRQTIRISNVFGGSKQAISVPEMPELLPGYSFTFTTKVRKVLPALLMTGSVTIDPVSVTGNVDPATSQVSDSATFWAVYWPLVALLLLIAGEVGRRLWLRRRRGRASGGTTASSSRPTGGSGSGAGRAPGPAKVPAALFVAGVSALMVLGIGVATPARAATGSDLTFIPGKGLDISPMYTVTPGPCPREATNVVGWLKGRGLPAKGLVVIPNSAAPINYEEAFGVPLQDTLSAFAKRSGVKLRGTYTVTVQCVDELATKVFREFSGPVTFSTPKRFTAPTPKKAPADGVPVGFLAQVFPEFKGTATPAPTGPASPDALPAAGVAPAAVAAGADTGSTKVAPFLLIIGGFIVLGGVGFLYTRTGAARKGLGGSDPAVEWPDEDPSGSEKSRQTVPSASTSSDESVKETQ